MASVLAIVAKAIFEKQARGLGEGDVWPTDRYASKGKLLETLADGGSLFLVTVRPPEELWLVAVLDAPEHDGEAWTATANTTPIRSIHAQIGKLQFATGKGLTFEKGKLGMSLQGPRVLADTDVALLRGAPASAVKASAAKAQGANASAKVSAAKSANASAAKASVARASGAKKPVAAKQSVVASSAVKASAAKAQGANASAKVSAAKSANASAAKASVATASVAKQPVAAKQSVVASSAANASVSRAAAAKGAAVSLDELYAALDGKQHDHALALMIELWKSTHSPVLAEAIDVLTTRVGSGAIEGDSPAALAKAWNTVEKAGDSADLELLLAQIRAGTDIDGVAARIDKLAKRYAGDPRLASFVHKQLDDLAFTASSSAGVWKALFEMLDRVHDPRTVAVVERTRARWDAKLAARGGYRTRFLAWLDKAATAARGVAITADVASDLVARVSEINKRVLSEDEHQLAALFAEVYNNPDDDHVRMVLADALVERDDPRGELIHLQLRENLSKQEQRRAKELVEAHGREWLGALTEWCSKKPKELVYERGFATRMTIVKPPTSQPAFPVDAPEMATLETLDLGHNFDLDNPGLYEWIRRFPRVRRLEASNSRLERLVEGGPVPYVELVTQDPGTKDWFTRENFPKLERVTDPWDRMAFELTKDWKRKQLK